MTYLEKKNIKGNEYYYLTKNVRRNGKWKKVRKYVGKKKPTAAEIKKLSKDLSVPPKSEHLSETQLATLNKIKVNYGKYEDKLSQHDFKEYEKASLTSFTYNSSAIEGSTLSLQETGLVLSKNITPPGKDLREIHGVTNMRRAYEFIKGAKKLTERNIKKIHELTMKNILDEELGAYRTVPSRIIGSRVTPPMPVDVPEKMTDLIEWYEKHKRLHPFELACLFHIKFEKIHPFRDGNGRVGRLIMNFTLLGAGYPLLDIKAAKRLDYYEALENAQLQGRSKHRDFINYCYKTYVEDAKKMGWV